MRGCLLGLLVLGVARPVGAQQSDFPDEQPERTIGLNLIEQIIDLMDVHPSIVSAQIISERSDAEVGNALSEYLPKLSVKGSVGYQDINSIPSQGERRHTQLVPVSVDAKLRQLIFDGGGTINAIEASRMRRVAADIGVDVARQRIVLSAVRAHVQLSHSYNSFTIAVQSADSIKRQLDLELVRFEQGTGGASDVLRARSRLADAESLVAREQLALNIALADYRRVFDQTAIPSELQTVSVPTVALPRSVSEALEKALSGDKQLQILRLLSQSASADYVANWRREFLPRLDLVGGAGYEVNTDGSDRTKIDFSILAELTFGIDFGSGDRVDRSAADLAGAQQQILLRTREVGRLVRVAWYQQDEATNSHELQKRRVGLAKEYLSIARRERELGRQSLLEVLSGEAALYAAQIDLSKSNARRVLSAYSLLQAMGLLNVGVVRIADGRVNN